MKQLEQLAEQLEQLEQLAEQLEQLAEQLEQLAEQLTIKTNTKLLQAWTTNKKLYKK